MGPEPGGYISEQIGERGGGRPKAKCIRRFKFDTQEIPLSSAEALKEEERKEEKNTEKTALARGGFFPEISTCSPFSSPVLQYIHCSPAPLETPREPMQRREQKIPYIKT